MRCALMITASTNTGMWLEEKVGATWPITGYFLSRFGAEHRKSAAVRLTPNYGGQPSPEFGTLKAGIDSLDEIDLVETAPSAILRSE